MATIYSQEFKTGKQKSLLLCNTVAKMFTASVFVRKLIGSFLLVVFAFSVTPVVFLHDAIANHKDVCYHHFNETGKQITQADINCKCISLVAEALYLPVSQTFFVAKRPQIINARNVLQPVNFHSQYHLFTELRGPPFLTSSYL